ncbi:RNA pyrophosphohydrolase [Thioflexithrix psekupsensis]|uniref:RNA pyrophosphohydrolase n=1 Tax=Thioflexithrix psekupsensis TaxID=1570016 RepID=A0A251X6P7_9GAMM|nr:RNA pyrophosphohydrolase [Thioflexithrix psekupsensis]OUD13141.1 RNA pyrophosphohydrolase [Thioflexithrix psekupsensis]
MIDSDGYRLNVGIILMRQDGRVLWAKRVGQEAWQFPQGGMKAHEDAKQAMLRELYEEIGLGAQHVEIVGTTRQWLRYALPSHLIRHHQRPLCIGQKQKWFLLKLTCAEDRICLDKSDKPEFERWVWVDYWHPLKEVVFFKRNVYKEALTEFEPLALKAKSTTPSSATAVTSSVSTPRRIVDARTARLVTSTSSPKVRY